MTNHNALIKERKSIFVGWLSFFLAKIGNFTQSFAYYKKLKNIIFLLFC